MKNKKLAVMLLSTLLFQYGCTGLTEPEKIILSKYLEEQKKEMDEKKKELEYWTNLSTIGMCGFIMYLGAAVGTTYLCKKNYDDYLISDEYIKKIMARFKKLRNLSDYNEKFKEFTKEISKISIECNKNDHGEETDLKRYIKKAKDDHSKSSFESQKTPFALIGSKSCPVCDDYTVVFGAIAQSYGLYCAAMRIYPNDNFPEEYWHSVLLLAKIKDHVTDPNKPWTWVFFDGRWFSSDFHKPLQNSDGTISIDHIDDAWGEKYKGGRRDVFVNMLSSWVSSNRNDDLALMLDDEDIHNLKQGGYLLIPKFFRARA